MKNKESKIRLWLKEKVNVKGVRFSIWVAFIVFTLVILGFAWLTQVFLFDVYFTSYRISNLEKDSSALVSAYSNFDYKTTFTDYAKSENVTLFVLESDGDGLSVKFFSQESQYGVSGVLTLTTKSGKEIKRAVSEFVASGEKSFILNSEIDDSVTYVCALGNKGNEFLVIHYDLGQINSTKEMLTTQMWIFTATVVVLSFIISFMISGMISKDLENLSHSAEEFAKGKTDIKFKESGFSEIKELATTLNYATAEVSKAETLRRELIANVSHDLRTPLTIIKGYAELIRDISGDKPEKRNQHLDSIIKETDRLTVLVRDMLNLSQLESNAGEIKREVFNLSDTTNRVKDSFKVFEELNGYHLFADVEEDIQVLGDPTRMELVLYNLISNSINYTGEDKTVFITLKREGERVRFGVRDTGKGMDSEQAKLIWQRYYRAKEHVRAVVGSGLGLSIVKAILDSHPQVDYGVNSKIGEGSEFYFSLPIAKNEDNLQE